MITEISDQEFDAAVEDMNALRAKREEQEERRLNPALAKARDILARVIATASADPDAAYRPEALAAGVLVEELDRATFERYLRNAKERHISTTRLLDAMRPVRAAKREKEAAAKKAAAAAKRAGRAGQPDTSTLNPTGAGISNCPASRPVSELSGSAAALIDHPTPVELVKQMIARMGYAGDPDPTLLAYIAVTSRLLGRPLCLQIEAPSSAGKSYSIDAALELFPPGRSTSSAPPRPARWFTRKPISSIGPL